MESKIQSSFIPKKPITSGKVHSQHGIQAGIFFFLSLFLLLAVVTISGGLFFYKGFLEQSISRKNKELQTARASFAPAQLNELKRLNLRIDTAQDLLNKHNAPTLLFDLLEGVTLKTVQFKDLKYSVLPDGRSSISMTGIARSFASVALQSDMFNKEKSIEEPIFSNLDVSQEGDALFEVSAFVGTDSISYRKYIEKSTIVPISENSIINNAEDVKNGSVSGSEGVSSSTNEKSSPTSKN